ncbi:ABC transporter substrate-binding protein [Paenibacillus tengchongensis]|uniref:ABC transporter substrate-binding protein n=1 Tax=Paenibacillus tengchongensis TaxID=2608684 RepID=UPI00124D5B70|nr:ABC transporter substrate-binding protein [Paenibacillus tengchongensis]
MRRTSGWLLSAALLPALLLSGCGGRSDEDGVTTVHIYQFKVEIAEALTAMKAEFEKEHPEIRLDIQTVGGGTDYGASLRAKFSSGDEPDIFTIGGNNERDMWLEYLEDLSGESWAPDVKPLAAEQMTVDGKLYGMPMNLEGYGFIYNKDLFRQAGITEKPVTLSALRESARKLQDAGITPFANGYQEWFVLGNHNVNVAFAQQPDPAAFIAGLTDGSKTFADDPVFSQWVDLLDLTVEFGNPNPLSTDYNTQVTMLAGGEAAMMQQGNWTQGQIDGIDPDLNLGILPMPIDDTAEDNDKLYVGVPSNWVINKNSPVKEEAKVFLDWMVTSDTGKRYITKEFQFIPALDSIEGTEEDLGALGAEVLAYTDKDQALTWNWSRLPNGMPNELSSSIQGYLGGKLTKEGMLKEFQKNWDNLSVQ